MATFPNSNTDGTSSSDRSASGAQPDFSTPGGTIGPGNDQQLPAPTATTLGGVNSFAPVTHKFLTGIGTNGLPTAAQPAQADITGLTTASTPTFSAVAVVDVALSGTTPGTLADGMIWFDGTNFKARTGGVTKTISLV